MTGPGTGAATAPLPPRTEGRHNHNVPGGVPTQLFGVDLTPSQRRLIGKLRESFTKAPEDVFREHGKFTDFLDPLSFEYIMVFHDPGISADQSKQLFKLADPNMQRMDINQFCTLFRKS